MLCLHEEERVPDSRRCFRQAGRAGFGEEEKRASLSRLPRLQNMGKDGRMWATGKDGKDGKDGQDNQGDKDRQSRTMGANCCHMSVISDRA